MGFFPFDVFQLPSLSPGLLPRLLCDFKVGSDKQKIMMDWHYGEMPKLDHKKLFYFYQYLFNELFIILETVYTPYIDNYHGFIPPHETVVKDFSIILQFFLMIQNHMLFGLAYNVDLKPFNPIDGDQERLLNNWKKLRGSFLDHRAKIKSIILLKGITGYPIPYRLWRFNKAIVHNLSKQREFQKEKELPSDKHSLTFTARRSHKKSVYKMLEKNMNEVVNKKEILKKVNISYDSFRSIIAELRNDLVRKKLSNSLKIDNDKKGGYKLVKLA